MLVLSLFVGSEWGGRFARRHRYFCDVAFWKLSTKYFTWLGGPTFPLAINLDYFLTERKSECLGLWCGIPYPDRMHFNKLESKRTFSSEHICNICLPYLCFWSSITRTLSRGSASCLDSNSDAFGRDILKMIRGMVSFIYSNRGCRSYSSSRLLLSVW